MMAFKTEAHLFEQVIKSPFIKNFVSSLVYPTVAYIELGGFFGVPDLVIANLSNNLSLQVHRTFAFEMKLSNWKRALVQAYKYSAFVNLSFVVIDRDHLGPALKNIDQFILSNIGLLSIDRSGFISTHHLPNDSIPYSSFLQQKLERLILKEASVMDGQVPTHNSASQSPRLIYDSNKNRFAAESYYL